MATRGFTIAQSSSTLPRIHKFTHYLFSSTLNLIGKEWTIPANADRVFYCHSPLQHRHITLRRQKVKLVDLPEVKCESDGDQSC